MCMPSKDTFKGVKRLLASCCEKGAVARQMSVLLNPAQLHVRRTVRAQLLSDMQYSILPESKLMSAVL